MKHSFGIDVLSCRKCKGRMRFVAVLFEPAEVRRLLCHLRCFSDPLPIPPPERVKLFETPSMRNYCPIDGSWMDLLAA